jgi:Domain of Unknown Function (DUF1080)
MKYFALFASLLLVSAHAEEKYKELFNGKDLTGWEGDKRLWSVQDGLLTGQTTADTKLEKNTFCIWTGGEVGDFELEATFRLEGDNNSGIQYRSKKYPKNGPYAIVGYQADIHPAPNYVGMLYDEGGRGIAAERGQAVKLLPHGQKEVAVLPKSGPIDVTKWSKLEVRAQGNALMHSVNGQGTVTVVDNDPKNAESKGILALQVHAGPPMKVQFKSIKLKPLKKGEAADSAAP